MSYPIDTLRLQMLANGDPERLSRLHQYIRSQEANGDIRIVFMDDEIAQIQYLNPAWARVLMGTGGVAS